LERVDRNTRVVVHFAECFVFVHRDRQAPVLHLGGGLLHGSLLFRRQRCAPTAPSAPRRASGGTIRSATPVTAATGSARSTRTASASAARRRARVALRDIAHQLDRADAAIQAVF